MKPTAVIVAGGSGKRMRTQQPKQFLLLNGVPILVHTVRRFLGWKDSMEIALVLPEIHLDTWSRMAEKFLSEKERARVMLCTGGSSRTASVWSGLKRLKAQTSQAQDTIVGIHDGVRPFVHHDILDRAYSMASEVGASVVCVPVKASLRKNVGEEGSVPVDRSLYYEVQTPQVFQLDAICQAFEKRAHDAFTDDASLYQEFGGQVNICEGSYDNIKITTPEDLAIGLDIMKRMENSLP